jgi:hypothetical protein
MYKSQWNVFLRRAGDKVLYATSVGFIFLKIESSRMTMKGLTIVILGTLKLKRAAASAKAVALGAKVVSIVDSQTDIVVCGRAPGKKKKDAETLGIEIINEQQFLDRIANAQSSGSSKKRKALPILNASNNKKKSVDHEASEQKKSKKASKRKVKEDGRSGARNKKQKVQKGTNSVLEDIYACSDSPLENWTSAKPLDQWEGITVGEDGNIKKLILSGKRLRCM